ncbi:50S ribosomal protein L40e [Candidatus Pacearchaeota archaeon CG_4_9_14_3_um_filter_31_7]|nr:MAG: 50S ribosomal protein L40e [Candidatus Pacearchaeota archaeon CG10_big_fil_rev_8_21_14_0_10_31_59]PIZ79992.1 MAG: 50S ribosomal protein L40e [Candidatus Pacearchaeota archaeon CG_4_10_14_0_2_um_filter_31_10]PJA70565.1 MAG: 50S ribosomal protein L40e [Candidatus Pacearchaeota archaeon CG_4_9_14_3_um_filter_31_7]
MVKIASAQARLFKNIFVCKKCGTKMRAQSRKIVEGKIKCRNCGKKAFRPKRKK